MKKLIVSFAFAVATLFLTSCISSGNPQEGFTVYLTLLTEVKSEMAGAQPQTVELTYKTIDGKGPDANGKFAGYPLLSSQRYLDAGQNPVIDYLYGDKTLTVKTTTPTGTTSELFKLNDKSFAYEILKDGNFEPYSIKYGMGGERSSVDGVQLVWDGRNYHRAISEGKEIASYSFTSYENLFGIQQFGIYGSEKYWYSDRFGFQNRNLLRSMDILEAGQLVNYTFDYIFSSNGLINREIIKRGGAIYITNEYTYKQAVAVIK